MLWKVKAMAFRLPNAITLRVSLLFTLLAAIVFLATGLVIRAAVDHHFKEQDHTTLLGKLELIRNIVDGWQGPPDSLRVKQQLHDALVGHPDLQVRIDLDKGTLFFATGASVSFTVLSSQVTAKPHALVVWRINDVTYRGFVVSVATGNPAVTMGALLAIDTSHHNEFLTAFERQLLLICLGALLLMSGFSWLAAKRGLTPLQDMVRVAQGISADQLQGRLDVDRVPVELQTLANSFNAMLDRLGGSLQRLSEFSSDLAHELRTPINNLMTQTQVSLSKPRTAQEYGEILYSNLEEYERLARMISDMLFLAKADHGLIVPRRERVDLATEVDALFEFYDALAAEKAVCLERTGTGHIMGDRLMIRRALSNLLSNAIRHTPQDSAITVNIGSESGFVVISVENPGSPVPPDQLPRLFDRFYRGSASRHRTDEGAGLGLAISQSIVKAHLGSVTASSDYHATRFVFSFPNPTEGEAS